MREPGSFVSGTAVGDQSNWKQKLQERLPLYGHRNWVVVADAAYPAQARDGIETMVADADQTAVLETVLAMLRASKHVKPTVYTDQELQFVEEHDAVGISAYRGRLADLVDGFTANVLPHEEIIAKLDRAGQTYRVLIIKTSISIPYTSVFFELGCAYWNSDAESRLRTAIKCGVGRKRRGKNCKQK
jgi:L-fucose mutarotase/ribose pyranase (RbsD/FucU family)